MLTCPRATRRTPIVASITALAIGLLIVARLSGQDGPALRVLSRDGATAIPLAGANQDYVAIDDLATAFQLTVREEGGAITVAYRGQTIVLTLDRTLASSAGRLISLPSAPVRVGGRVLVPLDFISRALALVYDVRLDLRRTSRLLVVGDLRVPQVTVRSTPQTDAVRVTIDVRPGASSAVVQTDGRITIRIEADAIDATLPGVEPGDILQAVQVLDPVTIALRTGSGLGGYRATTQSLGNAERVIVDLLPLVVETAPALSAVPLDPESATAAAPPLVSGEPAVFRTVVIDPGHGGEDRGVQGPNGLLEKDLTLAVARRLKSSLEAATGLRVLLTRDDDRYVPVDRRAAVANNNNAGVFISLHANASPRESVRGAAVSVAAFGEGTETRASVSLERVSVIGGGARDLELLSWDFAQIRHVDRSWQLATILERQLAGRVPLDTPAVGRVPFRVLESANMPAVLIEMGYLTNIDQSGQLAGGGLQATIAQAVTDAVVQFRRLEAGEGGQP